MTKKDKLRLSIFKKYAQNLNALNLRPNKNEVVCPICLDFFGIESLDQSGDHPLSLEDVPPKALGGIPIILTCKQCNNKAGTELDKPLITHLQQKPFEKRQKEASVRLHNTVIKSGDDSVRGTAILKRIDENKFAIDMDVSDKYRLAQIQKLNVKQEWQITYKPHTPPPVLITETAILRIGYLLAFQKFGHTFALNRNFDGIRKQICNPSKIILPTAGVLKGLSLDSGIYFIKEPIEARGLLVSFSLRLEGTIENTGVLLNPPEIDSVTYYSILKTLGKKTFRVGIHKFTESDYLSTSGNISKFEKTLQEKPHFNLAQLGFFLG